MTKWCKGVQYELEEVTLPLIEYRKISKSISWSQFFLFRPLDGFLFEMGFFLDGLFIESTFANSRGVLLFKMNAANIEVDDYKAMMSKTTAHIFQTRNLLKFQFH